MTAFAWYTDVVPADMRVTQVYGFVFASDGRVVLHTDAEKVSLPGGTPEGVETCEETLIREVMEEITCTITDPVYLGYQHVDEQDGTAPYAQLRMVARLRDVFAASPDPATGLVARRTLLHPAEAAARLGWGDLGCHVRSSFVAEIE
jgi:8-oxo-dGTP pyrophosphatase MutT (NUDIX family)